MISMNEGLDIILAAAVSKTDWFAKVGTALGASRTIQLKRDPNPAAVDPWTTGVEKINTAITGALVSTGGNVSGFGTTSAASVQLIADLSSGISVLRTTGANGNFWQGTIGLTKAKQTALGISPLRDYDFYLPDSPTTTTGIGFVDTCRLNAPAYLPSGIGPAAPEPHAAAPYRVKIWDYQNSGSPVLRGAMIMTDRRKDMVLANIAQQQITGDTRVDLSPTTVDYDTHTFCCMRTIAAASNTKSGLVPFCKVYVWTVPLGQWSGYPSMVGFNQATVENFPKPYKVTIEDEAGNLLKTHELPGGQAYNSTFPASPNNSGTFFLHTTTANVLIWENTESSISPRMHSIFGGMTDNSTHPAHAAVQYSSNDCYPAITYDVNQRNGMGFSGSMAAYPLAIPDYSTQTQTNPYLYNINDLNYSAQWCHGYMWVAGQPNGHGFLRGPGGTRPDRSFMTTVLAQFITEPTGVRLEGAVPYELLAREWGKAHWNHSRHYIFPTNPRLFQTISDRNWGYFGAYYNGNALFGIDAAHRIPLLSVGQNESSENILLYQLDHNQRFLWNGDAPDAEHTYDHPMQFGVIFNDTSFAIAQKFKTNATFMAQLGENSPTAYSRGYFLVRTHAWRMENFLWSWMAAGDHEFLYPVEQIEDWIKEELEFQWAQIYDPVVNQNEPGWWADCLRNLGHTGRIWSNGSVSCILSNGGSLGYYMGGILAQGARLGFLDRVRSLSTKCAEMIDFTILCFDKASSTWMDKTNGARDDYTESPGYIMLGPFFTDNTTPVVYASWAAANTANPPVGPQDWIHRADGTFYEQYIGQHLRAQWPRWREHYIKHNTYVDTAAALAKYDAYHATVVANITAASGYPAKRAAAFAYLLGCHGQPKPPVPYP